MRVGSGAKREGAAAGAVGRARAVMIGLGRPCGVAAAADRRGD
jgi:hypothetical protein